MPVTAIKFFGFILKNFDEILLNKSLTSEHLIIKLLPFRYLQFFEHITTDAPLLIASSMKFSPLILLPLIAKKINPFLIFLLFIANPLIQIFFFCREIFN